VKALRIAQWMALALLVAYLLLLHNANPTALTLPFLPPLPPALVLGSVATVAFLVGFLPSRMRLWRNQRKLQQLQTEHEGLERALADARREEPSDAIIPDRPRDDGPAPPPSETQ
jgi:hypothetical protein